MFKHLLTFIWNRKGKNALLIIELAFAFLILFGVLSFVLFNLERYNTPLGFRTENILYLDIHIPVEKDSTEIAAMNEELTNGLRALEGIDGTAITIGITPFSNSNWVSTEDENGYEIHSNIITADEDFAELMDLNIVEGRWMRKEDQFEKYPAIAISQKLKEEVWGDSNVIGKVIWWDGKEKQIVGVVEHYKYLGEFEEEKNIIFEYYSSGDELAPCVFIRTGENTTAAIEEKINNVVKNIAKDCRFVIRNLERDRKFHSLDKWVPITGFICISLFLIINVALGLYGVLLYNIKKRRAEIGLRRAIGASPKDVFSQLIIEMMLISFLALILGGFFAVQVPILGLFEMGTSLYFQAGTGATLIIILLVLVCTIYPGMQAILVQPSTALHEE